MKKIYFIGGLGSNVHYVADLEIALGYPIHYLDLPGHGTAKEVTWTSLSDVEEWFENQTGEGEEILLVGHSIGADVAVYLACRFAHINKLCLLDGGFIQMGQVQSLEDELKEAADYLEMQTVRSLEEAVAIERATSLVWSEQLSRAARTNWRYQSEEACWKLDLGREGVLSLLEMRRQMEGYLEKVTVPTLLLLADLHGQSPDWREEMIEGIPSFVQTEVVKDTGHSLYTEKPRLVADCIQAFERGEYDKISHYLLH